MVDLSSELYDSEVFLGSLGRCITSWAFIEEKLFEICVIALKAPRKQTAIVYYRTPTIDSRLKLIDELVSAALPERIPGKHATPIEIDWSKITKEFGKLLPERNALAHFPMKGITSRANPKGGPKLEDYRLVLKFSMRPHRNELLRKEPLIMKMDADMLPAHLTRVRALELELFKFQSTLRTAISK